MLMRKVGATMVVPATDIVPAVCRANGINESLARRGLYPLANVGGDPYGRYIYMRVLGGMSSLFVTLTLHWTSHAISQSG